MNHFDMLPCDVQDVILEFKKKTEIKNHRVKKMRSVMINLRKQNDLLYNTAMNTNSVDATDLLSKWELLESNTCACEAVMARLQLELDYENPIQELGVTEYKKIVKMIRNNIKNK